MGGRGADEHGRAGRWRGRRESWWELARRCRAWLDRHAGRVAVGAALSVLVVGGALSLALGRTLTYYDEKEYLHLADGLVSHGRYTLDGQHPTAWRPPGYPVFLAAVRWLGVGVVGLRFAGVVLLAASVVGMYLLGRTVFGRAAGALAAVGMALSPLLLYTAASLYPQAAALALLVGGLLATALCAQAAGRRMLVLAVVSGSAFGALVLTVPTYALALPLALGWLALRGGRGRGWRLAAVVLAASVVLPVAWTVRNAVELKAFVPVATNDGSNLLLGNNENATPTSGARADTSRYEKAAAAAGARSEVAQSEAMRAAALRWIRGHPRQAAWLYLGKVANHFNYQNDYATRVTDSRLRSVAGAVTYLPVLALFLARVLLGVTRRLPFRRFEPVLVALVLVSPLAIAVYTTRLRYRLPLDAFMIAVVAGFVCALVARRAPPQPPAPSGRPTGREPVASGR